MDTVVMYVLTIDFFMKKSSNLREELDHKQKTIDNLLKIINQMHANSNESGENIHKNANTQSIQINATAEEQGRNNITIDDITYQDIPLNQTQGEEHRDEKLQRHQVIENRSIITIKNQLTGFRKKQQRSLQKLKNPMYHLNQMKTFINGIEIETEIPCCLVLKKEEFQKGIERSKLKTSLELRSMTCVITSSHY